MLGLQVEEVTDFTYIDRRSLKNKTYLYSDNWDKNKRRYSVRKSGRK